MSKRIIVFSLLFFSAASVFAQGRLSVDESRLIPAGATVYIEPAGGFETDLAAALAGEKVPLTVLPGRGGADFVISAGGGIFKTPGTGADSKDKAAVTVRNVRTGVVAFDYEVNTKSFARGKKGQAEACAAQLRNRIKKDGKSFEKMKKAREKAEKDMDKARQNQDEGKKDLEKAKPSREKGKKNPEKDKK